MAKAFAGTESAVLLAWLELVSFVAHWELQRPGDKFHSHLQLKGKGGATTTASEFQAVSGSLAALA
jgi:hypothetical protein